TLREACEKQHGAFPTTWLHYSGRGDGGGHLFYRVPLDVDVPYNSSAIGMMDGTVEVLGYGHYVVLAPSVHPETHRQYKWDREFNPWTMPMTMAPDWLIQRIQQADPSSHGESLSRDKAQEGNFFVRQGNKGETTTHNPRLRAATSNHARYHEV